MWDFKWLPSQYQLLHLYLSRDTVQGHSGIFEGEMTLSTVMSYFVNLGYFLFVNGQ